jgi:hypothetical protein
MLETVLLSVVLATACSDETPGPGPEVTLPEPVIVGAEQVPAPADEGYYLSPPTDGAEPALTALLAGGIAPAKAWYPTHGTPCMGPTATEALVVELGEADERIAELGYIEEPGQWLVNCGIDSVWEYTFEE